VGVLSIIKDLLPAADLRSVSYRDLNDNDSLYNLGALVDVGMEELQIVAPVRS